MDRAWIDGKAVALKAAIAEAAKLLGASRFPLIAGLGADVAGTRAAIAPPTNSSVSARTAASFGVVAITPASRFASSSRNSAADCM